MQGGFPHEDDAFDAVVCLFGMLQVCLGQRSARPSGSKPNLGAGAAGRPAVHAPAFAPGPARLRRYIVCDSIPPQDTYLGSGDVRWPQRCNYRFPTTGSGSKR